MVGVSAGTESGVTRFANLLGPELFARLGVERRDDAGVGDRIEGVVVEIPGGHATASRIDGNLGEPGPLEPLARRLFAGNERSLPGLRRIR